MAVLRCKMCGGDLAMIEGSTLAECENCGTRQTVPSADNEKKLQLFERANRLRMACEFDKAAGIYESIISDFPTEAEAYWGLVLCKYGIEYVEDPGSTRRVPTCHRSSFESVMDDPDLDQAMENADETSRRQYRQEAKEIEELRKGIIEVSGKEEPYDIFICYKETDYVGQRTLDSVLAQDVYDALTDKGYRVFFSRISLEDKLGLEYEPYIFAALNSAKLMLVFGTDYEYFNAVWVKNEWSRFLKLMAKDKQKHLIACYKGIDAYDIPKEFARLQAQDMGKLGADQDLLRGIEKLLPRKVETVRETVVVQQGGGSNSMALLKRGNMALEDGDWQKADGFFEEVLNQNPECAEAYLGKALAEHRCARIADMADQYIRSFAPGNAAVDSHKYDDKIREAAKANSVGKYFSESAVKTIFDRADLGISLSVDVAMKAKRIHMEKWNAHKQLVRARQFAAGDTKKALENATLRLENALQQVLDQAKRKDAESVDRAEKAFATALRNVQAQRDDAMDRRERDYESVPKTVETDDEKELRKYITILQTVGEYKDAGKILVKYRQALEKIVLKEKAIQKEKEEQRRKEQEQKEKLEQERREVAVKAAVRKKKLKIIVLVALAVAAVLSIVVYATAIKPGNEYKKAEAVLAEGNKGKAAIMFYNLKNYKDARERSHDLWDEVAQRKTVAVGGSHVIAIKENGTVVAAGRNDEGQCDVSGWTDIVDVAAGDKLSLGLRKDGTVVAAGEQYIGQEFDTEGWTDIVSIQAYNDTVAGLKADGTVLCSSNEIKMSRELKNIVAFGLGSYKLIALDCDGIVHHGLNDISFGTNVVAVACGGDTRMVLHKNGNVTWYGDGGAFYSLDAVNDWPEVVSIGVGARSVAALTADGKVLAAGYSGWGGLDVEGWNGVVALTLCGNSSSVVGFKQDGSLYFSTLPNDAAQEALSWTGIRIPDRPYTMELETE